MRKLKIGDKLKAKFESNSLNDIFEVESVTSHGIELITPLEGCRGMCLTNEKEVDKYFELIGE